MRQSCMVQVAAALAETKTDAAGLARSRCQRVVSLGGTRGRKKKSIHQHPGSLTDLPTCIGAAVAFFDFEPVSP